MIDLPLTPGVRSAGPIFLDAGGIVKGGLGAPDQRINRLGSRFGLAVVMPPIVQANIGRQWISRLIQGKTDGARMRWPLNGFKPGAPGDIRVNGAGQSGSILVLDGATPNYVAREGQFFSIITSGRRFLYMVTAETIFNSSGQASVPIAPMLRFQHADNDVCEFGVPMIEGFIQGDTWQWEWALANVANFEFEIHERA